jgi:2-isopropylmalate synthase
MERIYVFDTTLRDGEQVPGCQLNTIEKIQVAKALELLELILSKRDFPYRVRRFNSLLKFQKPSHGRLFALLLAP